MVMKFNEAYEKYFKGKFGISKVRELIRSGQLPIVKIPSRHYYFDSDAVEKWLQEGVQQEIQPTDYGVIRQLK